MWIVHKRKNKYKVYLVLVMKIINSGLYDAELKYICFIFTYKCQTLF